MNSAILHFLRYVLAFLVLSFAVFAYLTYESAKDIGIITDASVSKRYYVSKYEKVPDNSSNIECHVIWRDKPWIDSHPVATNEKHSVWCLFQDIYYNRKSREISLVLPRCDTGKKRAEVSEVLSHIRSFGLYDAPFFKTQVLQSFPLNISYSKLNGTHVYHCPEINDGSPGHAMVDVIFPVFRLISEFNLQTYDQDCTLVHGDYSIFAMQKTTRNKERTESYFNSLCRRHIHSLDTFCIGPNDWCKIDTMLAGLHGANFHFPVNDSSRIAKSFELSFSYLVKGFLSGHQNPKLPQDDNPVHVVLIHRLEQGSTWPKTFFQYRKLELENETVYWMTNWLESQPNTRVSIVSFETMTSKEQAEYFQNATIIIGVDGGAFENLVLARKGIGLIIIGRHDQNNIVFNHDVGYPGKWTSVWKHLFHYTLLDSYRISKSPYLSLNRTLFIHEFESTLSKVRKGTESLLKIPASELPNGGSLWKPCQGD